ncbi:hypothetical protein DSM112329_02937 [Paraconexibacter sp. AEG42_29]|uniref:Uncharacterized protein n=1 Tax=Paraconexibacter sp. AEG42_29 TaxID=2997339 RepID=A0AAU7AXA2_9ACTN
MLGPPAPAEESATAGTPGAAAQDPAALPATGEAGEEDNVHGTSRDLLTDNGLRSPWCAPGRRLMGQAERNCTSGGLASSGASGDNASFDRHVDTSSWTGAPKIDRWFISIVLTILSFAWTLMVTLTRGVFVALEFAFAFNPLDPSHRGSLAQTLDRQITAVTRPLALLLAPVGAVWLMWTTTVSRRPGHAAAQTLLSGLLITGALLILANPIGTIGAALTASQRVGLAVIGATAGRPGDGEGAAQSGLQAMADGVIDQPLALLEFGDVDWGTSPDKLDAELQAAALALARGENEEKVAAVRAARSNLDLFQVWPANSKQRNSINNEKSLLRVLCQSDEDTDCKGPNARYAEFRTERGAWQRALGLVVILLGLIPFWIALTFVAVKVIAAGLMATLRLLQLCFLTPLALIGEHGNRRLTSFAGDFAGNVLTAAAYSFFLGLIMLMWRLITTWPGYGFVMQWLLLALMLWQLIANRKSLWGTANAPRTAAMDAGSRLVRHASTTAAVRASTRAVQLPAQTTGLALGGARRLARRRPSGLPAASVGAQAGRRPPTTPPPALAGSPSDAPPDRARAARAAESGSPGSAGEPDDTAVAVAVGGGHRTPGGSAADSGAEAPAPDQRRVDRARQLLERQDERAVAGARAHRDRRIAAADVPALRERRAQLKGQLRQVTAAVPAATGRRRAVLVRRQASLQRRSQAVQASITQAEHAAQKTRAAEENPRRDQATLARRLDQQSDLPRGTTGPGERRQYPQLTALIDSTPEQFRSATAGQRLQMRHRIDRELQHRTTARRTINGHPSPQPRAEGGRGPAARPAPRTGPAAPGRRTDPRPVSAAGTPGPRETTREPARQARPQPSASARDEHGPRHTATRQPAAETEDDSGPREGRTPRIAAPTPEQRREAFRQQARRAE